MLLWLRGNIKTGGLCLLSQTCEAGCKRCLAWRRHPVNCRGFVEVCGARVHPAWIPTRQQRRYESRATGPAILPSVNETIFLSGISGPLLTIAATVRRCWPRRWLLLDWKGGNLSWWYIKHALNLNLKCKKKNCMEFKMTFKLLKECTGRVLGKIKLDQTKISIQICWDICFGQSFPKLVALAKSSGNRYYT